MNTCKDSTGGAALQRQIKEQLRTLPALRVIVVVVAVAVAVAAVATL